MFLKIIKYKGFIINFDLYPANWYGSLRNTGTVDVVINSVLKLSTHSSLGTIITVTGSNPWNPAYCTRRTRSGQLSYETQKCLCIRVWINSIFEPHSACRAKTELHMFRRYLIWVCPAPLATPSHSASPLSGTSTSARTGTGTEQVWTCRFQSFVLWVEEEKGTGIANL